MDAACGRHLVCGRAPKRRMQISSGQVQDGSANGLCFEEEPESRPSPSRLEMFFSFSLLVILRLAFKVAARLSTCFSRREIRSEFSSIFLRTSFSSAFFLSRLRFALSLFCFRLIAALSSGVAVRTLSGTSWDDEGPILVEELNPCLLSSTESAALLLK